MKRWLVRIAIAFCLVIRRAQSFVPRRSRMQRARQDPPNVAAADLPHSLAVEPSPIPNYDEAVQIIDASARTGIASDDLFNAVHFLERHAVELYHDPSQRADLWQRAHGSWKLQLSTGSAKNQSFHPPPWFLPFSYAMIDDTYFGNGVGWNENFIWISLLHKHYYDPNHRQMVVLVADMFLGGHKVTKYLPERVRHALHMGKTPQDFYPMESNRNTSKTTQRPPTFVIIGATEQALIARGNQSGGLTIWTRLPKDIRTVAYSYQDMQRLDA